MYAPEKDNTIISIPVLIPTQLQLVIGPVLMLVGTVRGIKILIAGNHSRGRVAIGICCRVGWLAHAVGGHRRWCDSPSLPGEFDAAAVEENHSR